MPYHRDDRRNLRGESRGNIRSDGKPQQRKTGARADMPQGRQQSERFAKPSRPAEPPAHGQRHRPPVRPVGAPPAPRHETRLPPVPPQPIRPVCEGDEPLARENMLSGRNPIREAIRSGRDIERLLVSRGELSGSAREIVAMARENHIVVQSVDRARLDEITPNHQGMIAFASAFRYGQVDDMFALAKERGEPVLLVLMDGVTDPHNLGAVIRTAECAGAHGVIVPERRAVGLTPAAVKASAGAVEYLPVARTGNMTRFIEDLKRRGVWVFAADMAGEPYTKVDMKVPMAIVIGAEGTGVSRLVLEHADLRVALPVRGHIESLNASVAAGILLYEILRQRG